VVLCSSVIKFAFTQLCSVMRPFGQKSLNIYIASCRYHFVVFLGYTGTSTGLITKPLANAGARFFGGQLPFLSPSHIATPSFNRQYSRRTQIIRNQNGRLFLMQQEPTQVAVMKTRAVRCKKLQSEYTNSQFFCRPDASPATHPTVSEH